jgi:hypothetical protein
MTNTVLLSSQSITVDTGDTFTAMLDAADNNHGDLLSDAICTALKTGWAYAAPAECPVTNVDLRPHPDQSSLQWVSAHKPYDILKAVESTGCLAVQLVLQEGIGRTYLSEGRSVSAVQVTKPFYVLTAERQVVSWTSSEPYQWVVGHRSDIVPAGCYLVAEIDDRRSTLVVVAGMNQLPDNVPAWLSNLNGFHASVCLAHCDTCHADWLADDGRLTFRPVHCDAAPWKFGDAEDVRQDSIACPACGDGRVRFEV